MTATASLTRPATPIVTMPDHQPATLSLPAPARRRRRHNRRARRELTVLARRRAGQCAFDAAAVRAELGADAFVTFDPATLCDLGAKLFEHYVVTGTVTVRSMPLDIILECSGPTGDRRRRYTIAA